MNDAFLASALKAFRASLLQARGQTQEFTESLASTYEIVTSGSVTVFRMPSGLIWGAINFSNVVLTYQGLNFDLDSAFRNLTPSIANWNSELLSSVTSLSISDTYASHPGWVTYPSTSQFVTPVVDSLLPTGWWKYSIRSVYDIVSPNSSPLGIIYFQQNISPVRLFASAQHSAAPIFGSPEFTRLQYNWDFIYRPVT